MALNPGVLLQVSSRERIEYWREGRDEEIAAKRRELPQEDRGFHSPRQDITSLLDDRETSRSSMQIGTDDRGPEFVP